MAPAFLEEPSVSADREVAGDLSAKVRTEPRLDAAGQAETAGRTHLREPIRADRPGWQVALSGDEAYSTRVVAPAG